MRKLLIFLSVCVALAAAAMLAAYMMVDEEAILSYLEDELGEEFSVEIGSVTLNPVTQTLEMQEISLDHADGRSEGPLFYAETIQFGQIDIFSLMSGNFVSDYLFVENFFLDTRSPGGGASLTEGSGASGILFFDSAELNNGRVLFTDENNGQGTIDGITLQTGRIELDTRCSDCSVLSGIENLDVAIPSLEYILDNGRYILMANEIMLNETDSELTLGALRMGPVSTDDVFHQSLEYRKEMFDLELTGLQLAGVHYSDLRSGERIAVRSGSVDSLNIHITLDKRIPRAPRDTTYTPPHVMLRHLPRPVAVDSLDLRYADICYSEYDYEGTSPGTICFKNTRLEFRHLYSESESPLTIEAASLLEGSGTLETEIAIWMDENQSRVDIGGTLRQFELSHLNNIFVPLEGIRIPEGKINDLEFRYIILNGRSDGTLLMNYEGLRVELVRPDNRQSVGNFVASLFVDNVVIRGSSRDDFGGSATGVISAESDPDKSFFNFIWVSLRSGISDIVRRF